MAAPLSRRCLLTALLAAAGALPRAGSAAAAAGAEPAIEAVEVEAGVWMLPGLPGAVTPANGGRTGNTGFIVGSRGVLAIGSGTSHRHGQALLAAIGRVTPLPVRLLLVTHVRQDQLFGASAFQEQGIPLHMQRGAAALMAARCDSCLQSLRAELGDAAMQGSRLPQPDVLFDHSHVVESIGRPVLVQHHGHASTAGDCSVFDARSGSLFAGGLIDNRRIPDLQHGDLAGWREALAALRGLRIHTIVPGHGPAGALELIASQQRYLDQLERRCAALLAEGTALSAVGDAADLPDYRRWDQYETLHRHNAQVLFLRLEQQQLMQGQAPGARQ